MDTYTEGFEGLFGLHKKTSYFAQKLTVMNLFLHLPMLKKLAVRIYQ